MGGRDVLLVGSVPLRDAAAVFQTCSAILGDRLLALPDGETGARTHWIAWQKPLLAANPAVRELAEAGTYASVDGDAPFAVDPAHRELNFGALGYAAAAADSWALFETMQGQGLIPQHLRFQVSLPTPLAVSCLYFDADSQPVVEAAYTARMFREVDAIAAAVPRDRLAIQWDAAVEFAVLEGLRPVHFRPVFEGIVQRLLACCAQVPVDVPVGLHLCYGDAGGRHFVEPRDMTWLVRVANAVCAGLRRPLAWLHMPVPRARDDDAYFAPLAALRLPQATRLVLGLVHESDGVAGAKRRIAAAERHVMNFGVATECGMGRRAPGVVPALLKLHAEL